MRRTPCQLALALSLAPLSLGPSVAAAAAPGATATASTVRGVVREVVVEHPGRRGPADVRTVLESDGRTLALPPGALPDNDPGDTVEVVLRAGSGDAASVSRSRTLAEAAPAPRTASAASATPAPAEHQVYVAIARPAGSPQGSPADAAARSEALVRQASDYWSSQTGGQVTFAVAQTLPAYESAFRCGTYVDPDTSVRTPSTLLMWNEALERFDAATGRADTAYGVHKHLLVVLPDGAPGCDYGLGTIGSLREEFNAVLVSGSAPSLYAHELGHNLGLNHSGALHCSTADAVATSTPSGWPSSCEAEEYGDVHDVMGYSEVGLGEGSLNGVHLDQLGLAPSAVQRITTRSTTTVPLVPLSSTGTGLRTVVVTDHLGGRYYAEYRTPTGRDRVTSKMTWLNGRAFPLGVRILREDPARRSGSYVLDSSPARADYDTALPVGGTFRSASGSVTIKVSSATTRGATLTVTRTAPPATVRVAVPARAAAGRSVTATARVRDQAGAAVTSWPVSLQVRRAGSRTWTTVDTATTGGTGTAAFSYTNGTTGSYRAVTRAAAGAGARTSASVPTTSYAAPSLAAPRSSATLGTRIATTGRLTGVTGRVVHLQARLGSGSWSTVARTARDGSTFTASYRPTRRGTWQLRYRAQADDAGRYTAGASTARTVVVR